MKKLILILLSLVVVSCSHIDEQVTPNKTVTTNTLKGSWITTDIIQYLIQYDGSWMECPEWTCVQNPQDTIFINRQNRYKIYCNYIFSDSTFKLLTNQQYFNEFPLDYNAYASGSATLYENNNTYSINNDTLKLGWRNEKFTYKINNDTLTIKFMSGCSQVKLYDGSYGCYYKYSEMKLKRN